MKLRFYVAGRRFHLYTDHRALSFMFTQKGLNPMLSRRPSASASMFVAAVVEKDALPVTAEGSPASEGIAPTSHPLLTAVELQDLASVTPIHEREALLQGAPSAGHRGSKATLARLPSEGHSWPGMSADCQRVARECIDCQRFTFSATDSTLCERSWRRYPLII